MRKQMECSAKANSLVEEVDDSWIREINILSLSGYSECEDCTSLQWTE